jgi:hypothetical protein
MVKFEVTGRLALDNESEAAEALVQYLRSVEKVR